MASNFTHKVKSPWLHMKTGRIYYLLLDDVYLEQDNVRAVLYRCQESGKYWVREYNEFFDGRFQRMVLDDLGELS